MSGGSLVEGGGSGMKLGKVVFASALSMTLAMTFMVADASACMRAMEEPEKKDDTPRLVAQAEQSLDAGKFAVATATMLKKFPALKGMSDKAEVAPLENRALRIVALASTRSDGAFGVATGAPAQRQKANLEWSVAVLRKMNVSRPGDASLQADLGEALSKLPGGQKEALTLLAKLAQDDLIGSPHAYAALSRLQSEAGEAQKSADAVKRCEGLTSTPAICQPKTAAPLAVPAKAKDAPVAADLKGRA